MATTIETGASAEDAAARFLIDAGLALVERNYRCQIGELDIIARDGDVLVFVEVRSRADDERGDPVETVNRRKQTRVSRVAAQYLHHKQPAFTECRFDVVAIHGEGERRTIAHYRDAWRLGGLL